MKITTLVPFTAMGEGEKNIIPPGDYNLMHALLLPDMLEGFLLVEGGVFIGELLLDFLKKSKLIKINMKGVEMKKEDAKQHDAKDDIVGKDVKRTENLVSLFKPKKVNFKVCDVPGLVNKEEPVGEQPFF